MDVDAATHLGVMVVNAPESNILSAAEHTMALLLSQARNVPQAHAALVAGRWERSKWEGVELADKTLGVIGLGRIGRLVAQRAAGFGMRIIAHDPYVSAERARRLSIDVVELDDLLARPDCHPCTWPRPPRRWACSTPIGWPRPSRACGSSTWRGGLIDEAALADAIRSGQVAGAALDVFAAEPTTDSPLFELAQVVVTPHLGASTREAQDKAGETIAEMVGLALNSDFVPRGERVRR
ncbi:MAG: NAD(P)-dependent oxidoreductase [Acidimicrobiales bacterium]